MKTDRLVGILMTLLNKKKTTAKALAEQFEVSQRTIYRDLDHLLVAGIPIETFSGPNGGVGIDSAYKVNQNTFTTDDLNHLLVALGQITPAFGEKDLAGLLEKVKSLVPVHQQETLEQRRQQIRIDPTTWQGQPIKKKAVALIRQGMENSRYLVFSYIDTNNVETQRKIEPYQLILKEGAWYCYGYCLLREAFRLFRVSRMRNLDLLDISFEPRAVDPAILNGKGWIDERVFNIQVLIDASYRDRVEATCGKEAILEEKGTWLLVEYPFVEDEFSYGILLSYGDKCQCLKPESVRNEVKNRIKKMLALYE